MSTAAVKTFPIVSGSSAADPRPAGEPGGTRKGRTPLSVVRTAPRKRRAPFVVLCFGMLAVALVAVLVLNISVSTSQYQLVELRAKQSSLTKTNQDLTQQVQNFQAPQNLAAKATELGMVPSAVKGQIDLSTLSVTGKAVPAVKGAAPGAVIPSPAVAGQLNVPPASTSAAADKAATSGAGNASPAARPADAAQAAADKAAAAQKAAADKAAAAAAVPAPELHGGSVPAPQQKAPGQ